MPDMDKDASGMPDVSDDTFDNSEVKRFLDEYLKAEALSSVLSAFYYLTGPEDSQTTFHCVQMAFRLDDASEQEISFLSNMRCTGHARDDVRRLAFLNMVFLDDVPENMLEIDRPLPVEEAPEFLLTYIHGCKPVTSTLWLCAQGVLAHLVDLGYQLQAVRAERPYVDPEADDLAGAVVFRMFNQLAHYRAVEVIYRHGVLIDDEHYLESL